MKGRDGTYNGTDIVSGLCIIMSRRKGRVLSARAAAAQQAVMWMEGVRARSSGVGCQKLQS